MRDAIRYLTRRVALGFAFGLCPLLSGLAFTQGAPVVELGVGYSYVRSNAPPQGCGCFPMHGGNGWLGYDLTRAVALVAEVSGQQASGIDGSGEDLILTSYLFGPRYSLRGRRLFAPFGQVLLGAAHASGSFVTDRSRFPGSSNAFAMVAGGGLDIGLTSHFAIRAFEADYYRTQFDNGVNDRQNDLRISTGIFFRIGEK